MNPPINKNKSPANSTLPHLLGQSKTAHVGVVDSKASKQNILIPSDVVNKFETGGKFSQSSTVGDRTITQVRDKLISRFGKRIVELLESKGILKIHQSMNDKDIPAEALRQAVFHGSPHKFDKFSLEHLGKGEGAQAYGWGLYFASKKAVSEWYRKNLTAPDLTTVLFKGKKYSFTDGNADNLVNDLTSYYGFNRRIVHSAIMEMRKHGSVSFAYSYLTHNVENKTKEQQDVLTILTILHNELFNHEDGQLYEVNIPEDDTMLLWDKPLSESPKFVIDALKKAKLVQPYEIEEMTGEDFYLDLYAEAGSRLGMKASDVAWVDKGNPRFISQIKMMGFVPQPILPANKIKNLIIKQHHILQKSIFGINYY